MLELEQKVIQWADERGIFEKATPYKQAQKTLEECGELLYAIGKLDNAIRDDAFYGSPDIKEAKDEIKDAIGDILVTISIQAHMQSFTLEECFQAAYDEIKNRKGKMINGQFVKEQN
jgi:NTP pyrophosphatase (non-canonical NTP hydrolase)